MQQKPNIEKGLDVMKRTVELSESCMEALEHIRQRINEGAFEQTIGLMDDLVNAVYHIEKSMQGYLDKLTANSIEEKTGKLRNALDRTVSAYEQREGGKALEIIQFNLLPSCKSWKEEIDGALHPYVLS